MKSLKKIAAITLLSLAVCGSAFAAKNPAKAAAKKNTNPGNVMITGQITRFEAGQIWIIEQANGVKIRADLGKHGGRLWRLKEMEFTGTFTQDEKGTLFKMDKVKFQDPVMDERLMRKGNGNKASVAKVQDDRDVAFYYPDQVPTDNKTYITQNVANVGDLSVYSEITAEKMLGAEVDSKVRLIGRPIQTIVKDKEMLFWDQANKPFRVVMNGAFIPLGQRSFVYGKLIGNSGVPRMSLEMVESIQ